ncbi:hypothetical protein PT974_10412 [Cladobotryum mycophilum]|uniref:Uncharacterized protein n=1 Tax=Cladobotryum mycophilum TaxID=491253 RepID=A0ABR0S9S7_9HYPO
MVTCAAAAQIGSLLEYLEPSNVKNDQEILLCSIWCRSVFARHLNFAFADAARPAPDQTRTDTNHFQENVQQTEAIIDFPRKLDYWQGFWASPQTWRLGFAESCPTYPVLETSHQLLG